jgi:hypothetical protein
MSITQRQAITTLDRLIERARDEEDRTFVKRYLKSNLAVIVSDDNKSVTYHWGINEVGRAVALNVVQSFEETRR